MKYADIYSKLVESRTDIVGHVAYSLYKDDKKRFIESFKEKNNSEPERRDVESFVDSISVDTCLSRYRMEAEEIINSFLSYALEETTDRIEKDCIKRHETILLDIIKPLKPEGIAKRYFHAIIQSILGAFFFALIAAAFMFIRKNS